MYEITLSLMFWKKKHVFLLERESACIRLLEPSQIACATSLCLVCRVCWHPLHHFLVIPVPDLFLDVCFFFFLHSHEELEWIHSSSLIDMMEGAWRSYLQFSLLQTSSLRIHHTNMMLLFLCAQHELFSQKTIRNKHRIIEKPIKLGTNTNASQNTNANYV